MIVGRRNRKTLVIQQLLREPAVDPLNALFIVR